ncbi:MAG: hypothetical protein KH301_08750 [Brachyspira sp.]|nr:hypothetical protein [Brachyspira sp.]
MEHKEIKRLLNRCEDECLEMLYLLDLLYNVCEPSFAADNSDCLQILARIVRSKFEDIDLLREQLKNAYLD